MIFLLDYHQQTENSNGLKSTVNGCAMLDLSDTRYVYFWAIGL
ncbi:MAG: hypothetical protein ACTS73_01830 [Arsenophonus sp. NEOnobi-MAG3]